MPPATWDSTPPVPSHDNWHEITPSAFAWEREALEHLRAQFPPAGALRRVVELRVLRRGRPAVWGRLAALYAKGLFLVEIRRGRCPVVAA